MRFQTLLRIAFLIFLLGFISGLGGVCYGGLYMYWGDTLRGAGLLLIGVGLMVIVTLAYCQFILMHKFESNIHRQYEAVLDAADTARQQKEFLRTIADNASLSEWAKKVVYREKDHEFVRDSILGAIIRQDWEGAEHLIQSLDVELGYSQEAAQLRDDVQRARQATLEEKVEAALKRFEQLCSGRKWDQARRETARLMKLFPGVDRIASLESEIELRRQEYKRHLLKEYDASVRRNEVERATQLLVELDRYLTPNEAAALRESARGVLKAKLLQMGVQFSLAVSDKQFASAIDVGQRIMREFPNSRYAHEIAEMLPALQRRIAHG
ncbi:MAG: hypothetical protein CHACPFDD_02675 [Phycisphaerae bacterium]|nr:hypothetical protein [Phycisphaerae bacterium]